MATESEAAKRVRENWIAVQEQVADSVSQFGREANSVKIVGVSKYVDAPTTRMLVDAGCMHLGENRPQLLWQKADLMSDLKIQWHQIGHLQRNKVRRVLSHSPIIHTVDSQRILSAIAQEATARGEAATVMLEVNISGDESKTGLAPTDLPTLLELVPRESVNVIGLMGMAGWGTEANQARQQFAQIRHLRDELAAESGFELPDLSMGMSGDFPEAIAEGATIVRIGSLLFEGVM